MNIKRLDDPSIPVASTLVGLILYGMQGGQTVKVTPTLLEGLDGVDGVDGASAYEVAVANGFVGTQEEWLESLKGADGASGNKIIGVSIVGDDLVYHLDEGEDITLTNGRILLRGEDGVHVSSAAFVENDLVFTLSDNSSVIIANAKSVLKGAAFTYEDFTQEQIDALKQPAIQAASEAGVATSNLTAQVNSKLKEVDDKLNGIADMSPFSISSEERVIGEYLLNGEKATIYEKTVELSALPTTANETKTYIISDQPLGYGLYFKVESFVASTGKGLSSQFFNSNYKITGYEINGNFNSVITIECVEAVSETVNGILHIRYCKFEGEVVELTLNLSSSDPIDVNGFTIPPLKYNKKFAISMSTDDAGADDYGKVFQYFNGGFIHNYTTGARYFHSGMPIPESGGWLSRPLTYTDGCGVQRRFPVQTASWFNLRNQYWFGPVKDIEPIDLTRSPSQWPYLYWQDIEEILDFDGAVSLHDVQDPNVTDHAGGTVQEIINGIIDAQDNFIYPRLGRRLLVMTEPNGDYKYVEAALQIPEIKLITRQQSQGGFGVIDANTIDLSTKVKLIRRFADNDTDIQHRNWFLTNVINPSLTNGQRMYGDFGMHGFGQTGGSYTFDDLPTMNKPKFFDWLCDTYGEHGSDELWFCTQDEFICYQLTKSQTTIKAEQIDNKVHLKVFLPKIPNVYWNEISILYNGNIPVTGIEPNNSITTLSYGNVTGGFMINLSTDERLLNCAEKYTTIFENVFDNENTGLVQYALRNANYFIQRLNPALQAPFRNRVDALISAPVLSSISINNGDATTQSQAVTISLNYSAGIPTHYKIGESSDLSLEEWIVIPSGDISFLLSAQFGVKTVYVQLMNAYGESDVVSDSIELVEADLALNSISINGGSLSTSNPLISIFFNLNGSATHYMISEDPAFAGAVWKTMANPATFSLSTSSYGNKTVYAKLKNDNTGITSEVKSAVIELIDTVTVTLHSIQINGGAEFTGSDVVSILPSFSNDATHYRVGESSDLSAVPWIPYTGGNISYTLTGGYGLRTVYLQLKNSGSESAVKSDQIEYVQAVILNSISLAGGASDHQGTNVPVSIFTSGGTPTHYRAGESSNLSAVPWIPYTGDFSYNFGSVGSKTLYVQVKNQISESSVVSDSITIVESPLTLLVGYWGYDGKTSNNKVFLADVNGTIYNSFEPASHTSYGSHNLYDNTGIETDIRIELNSSYYPINETLGMNQASAAIVSVASFHPTLSGDTGPHPDIVISQTKLPNNQVPGRLCFYLPAGQYKFRTIMSVSSSGAINETMRPNLFYRIYDMSYNVLAEQNVASGFTGLNNVDFNSELVFTLTEGQHIYYTLVPHVTGTYRPAANLIEITKLS